MSGSELGQGDRLNATDPEIGWQQLMWVDLRGRLPFSHLWNPPLETDPLGHLHSPLGRVMYKPLSP